MQFKSLWSLCCSLKLAISLASIATFLLMGGSLLFPGHPRIFAPLDSMTLSKWLASVASMDTSLSWWFYLFIVAMLMLLVNTLSCFVDWFLNIRARWRKTGEYLIHLGIICLLIGFAWGAVKGWRHLALPCTVGVLTPLPQWPGHYIAIDNFRPIIAPNGRPDDMISNVRVLAGEKQIAQGEVRINKPLLFSGIVVTPASFGQTAIGFVFNQAGQRLELHAGSKIALRNGASLHILRFLPDTQLNANGEMSYRTDRVGSPAMEMRLISADGSHWQGWYFLSQQPPEQLQSLNLHPIQPLYTQYSSLTVNYDPGIKLTATGGILTTIGCIVALFSFYRKRKNQDRPEM